MKDVAVKDTRSGRSDRTTNILCSSLQAFSHSPEERKRKRYQKHYSRRIITEFTIPLKRKISDAVLNC